MLSKLKFTSMRNWPRGGACPSKVAWISFTLYIALSIVKFSVYVSIPVQGGSAKVTLSPPLYGEVCAGLCHIVAVSTGRCLTAEEPEFISEQ